MFQKQALYNLLQTDWKLFGFVNAIIAFAYGIYGYLALPILDYHFYLVAPPLTYFILGYAWKWTFQTKNDYSPKYLIALVLILVPLIHYLSYTILTYYDLLDNILFPGPYSNASIKEFIYLPVINIPIVFYIIYKLYFSTLLIPVVIGIWVQKRFTQ